MLKKVFITPWFGPEPEWMDLYWEHALDKGFDWLVETDVDAFTERVREKLGLEAPIVYGGTKVHDYRACLGFLYEEEIAGYDFWGYTDFDCVYGRLEQFYPDSLLQDLDTYADHPSYMAGPFSLYRNTPAINRLFMGLATDRIRGRDTAAQWQEVLSQRETTGWVESTFTEIVRNAHLRSMFRLTHGWRDASVIRWDENRLMEGRKEIPFFHFRYTKEWPL